MIITVDGPTASGKSTIGRLLAEQFGYLYINSGLIFRGLAYILMQRTHVSETIDEHDYESKIAHFKKVMEDTPDLLDAHSIEKIMKEECFHYTFINENGPKIYSHTNDITLFLKTPTIDQAASIIGTYGGVRQVLLSYLRELANNHNLVADGRDCGTAVFPHAQYKFFLTASLDVRAARQQHASLHQGSALDGIKQNPLTLEELKKIIAERDARDATRAIAPLKPADDAYIIDSSHMTVQQVVDEIVAIVDSKSK